MAKPAPDWQDITLSPLTGLMDSRSRPAELQPGQFRKKLNLGINRSGKLCRRGGFSVFNLGDPEVASNWDFHRQGGTRESFNLLFESTSTDGVRRLFAGTQSKLMVQDTTTGERIDIATGKGAAGSRWHADELQDKVVFTNDVDDIQIYTLPGPGVTTTIPELVALGITKARIAVEFGGQMILMNVVKSGTRYSSRVQWSDNLDATAWDLGTVGTVAGFQDLDYGDVIWNAVEISGALYIFTTQSIWRMTVGVSAVSDPTASIYSFVKVYSDPKSQKGCLAYPNTLVSDGSAAYYFGKESVYTYSPLLRAPKADDDHDWLLKGSGLVFEGDNPVDAACCESPIGQYFAATNEVFFFYPRKLEGVDSPNCLNDYGLVLNTVARTCDHADYGMTATTSFRPAPSAQSCSAETLFIGASSEDWCLKASKAEEGVLKGTSVDAFSRQIVDIGDDITDDIIDLDYSITEEGYFSFMVATCPFGYPQREKTVRDVLLEHDTLDAVQAVNKANQVRLRLGVSQVLQDPLRNGPRCVVQWRDIELIDPSGAVTPGLPLQCPDGMTTPEMTKQNLRPSDSDQTSWPCYIEGTFVYFEIRITDSKGLAPKGSDSAFSRIVFSVLS